MKIRGFEIVSGYENINVPKRATKSSAGYDLESCEDISIQPNEVVLVKTGLKAYMLDDEVLKIFIRSSMATKKNVMLANNVGIIDSDYYDNPKNEGHIIIPIYNFSKVPIFINKGEKIAQGIFEKYLLIDNDEFVEEVRLGGFGSSNCNK